MTDYEHHLERGTERKFREVCDLAAKVGCIPSTTMTKSFTQDPVGWKVHFVRADQNADYADLKYEPSLCGMYPRHGWGLDMFIHSPCKRCERAALRELDLTR